jgi:hypothetical protein
MARYRRSPAVVQTLRATAAAVIAYVVALRLSTEHAPLTAPLTALLIMQVTLYSTLKTGIRRVNAVVVGVLIAITFSELTGLSWWSLGLIVLASLTIGRFVRVDEFVSEVAISAMLILGVTRLPSQAWERVLDTLIGAGVGLALNALFPPPVWVDSASESIDSLARRVRRLLLNSAEELAAPRPVRITETRLYEARGIDQDIADVDASLRQAEDSLRLNPRVREGRMSRVVLRTGLDTVEICVVVVRVLARSLTDLAKRRQADEPLFRDDIALSLEELFAHVGGALVSFAVLVTAQVSQNAEMAESRLTSELAAAWSTRDRVADMLLRNVQEHPHAWQLHGSLLAEVDRILDELALDHRSRRLMEELDRVSLSRGERLGLRGLPGNALRRVGRLARGSA